MVTLEPLDFNLPEDDYEKINLFLKDTQNFYMSLSEDYSDYFKDYSDNDKIIWNQLMNPLIEGIGKMTKLLENKTKYIVPSVHFYSPPKFTPSYLNDIVKGL